MSGGESSGLAPVIPLFADEADARGGDHDDEVEHEPADELMRRAEYDLLKKLRSRSLSVREARAVVAQYALDATDVDDVLADFVRRGYLDDAALAGQLVHTGIERKGHGRHVVMRTLADRGIPRDVADAAVNSLPNDDDDRALAFARTRARSMRGVEPGAALRRLVGQLSRRGYPGPVAMAAAKLALSEVAPGR